MSLAAITATASRMLRGLFALVLLAALVAGMPAALWRYIGWPLPHQLPTWAELQAGLTASYIPDDVFINTLACLCWLLWFMLTASVAIETVAAVRDVTVPRLPAIGPLQGLAASLVAAVAVSVLGARPATIRLASDPSGHAAGPAATAALVPDRHRASCLHRAFAAPDGPGSDSPPGPATAAQPPHRQDTAPGPDQRSRHERLWTTAEREPGEVAVPVVPVGHITLVVGDQRYTHTVRKGDNLSKIAKVWLGDANRWPEIYALNRGRHWPVGGTLTNPHLIYPGWVLDIPADATPPTQATAAPPGPSGPPGSGTSPGQMAPPGIADPAPPAPAATPAIPSPAAAPASPPPAVAADPDGVIGDPSTPASAPAATSPSQTSASPGAGDATSQQAPAPSTDPDDGLRLPGGGWMPWTLAGAIAAAAALVWLQRRRRYIPRLLDSTDTDHEVELADPPLVVRHIQRAWRRRTRTDQAPPPPAAGGPGQAEPAGAGLVPDVPPIEPLPAGGLGLVGPGAEAAARGALVAALASGAPTDPDTRTEVVIPAATLVTLLGADAVALGTWNRLRVTPDVDSALAVLETRLLHAARILDDNQVGDVATLRQAAPCE